MGDTAVNSANRVVRGCICAIIGAVCWGFSATCASYLMHTFGMSVTWLVSMRLIITGTMFLIFSLITARDKVLLLVHDKRLLANTVIFAIFGMMCIQVSYMQAVKHAGAGVALLLQETGVVMVMLYTCVKLRRLPFRSEVAAIVLAMAGVFCIATQGNLSSLGIPFLGLTWGLISGVCIAAYNIIPVKVLDKCGSLPLNGIGMPIAAVLFLPIGQPWNVPSMPWQGWAGLAAVCIIGTFIAYLAYLQGVKDAGPVKAGLVGMLEPVSGMAFSFIWLHEAITLYDAIGCVLIFGMLALVSKPTEQEGAAAEQADNAAEQEAN